jgi:transitional endoplasmic reticulum ATPase
MIKNNIDYMSLLMVQTNTKAQATYCAKNIFTENKAVELWILRLLVKLNGNKKFLEKNEFASIGVANFLGLEEFVKGDYDQQKARAKILQNYNLKNKVGTGLPTNTVLAKNIVKLAKCMNLSATEKAILHFTTIFKTNQILNEAIEFHSLLSSNKITRIFAGCLNIEHHLVSQALSPDAMLRKTGLIYLDYSAYFCIDAQIRLLDDLMAIADSPNINPINMFRSSFRLTSLAKLTRSDYTHLNQDIALLKQYINFVHKTKKKGVNVLIYGHPGTGKTEFSKMIAKLTKSILYEIGFEGDDMRSLNGVERFRAYRAAQTLFYKNKNHMVLFDEVEDVFFQPSDSTLSNSISKAMVNKVLEENPVPAIWLTNNVICIDNAFIRRFDYVIEIKSPPKDVREKLLNSYLVGLPVSAGWKKQMSKYEYLPPATIERAAEVVKAVTIMNPKVNADRSLHRLIGNSLGAMDMSRPIIKAEKIELNFDIATLNTDCDVRIVSEGIVDKGQARICLYGPPGTGKTAFGHYIAEKSGKHLIVKKASDIISPYLGLSEKNMARMFYDALDQDAILQLDEADTYLQDRNKLMHSWEVSGVNEMLTQIESFDGVFICSTNLMSDFDSAALRRFDLKIKFDYLNAIQAWRLFIETTKRLIIKHEDAVKSKLSELTTLTPGDFTTVLRQSRFRPVKDSWDLLARINAECAMKPEGYKQPIGFH